ncbi:MAG: S8 family serine peptidase, partial [Woeseia sp.]|nr:S8 family serine peptidase [Woeseia sp.]
MNNVTGRFGVFSASLLFTLMLGTLPMAPTAHGIPVNSGLDAAGQWSQPGPGIVANETGVPGEDIYIIRHQAPPLAQYRGDIPGLAATAPEALGANRLDPDSAASQAYLAYVAGLHANLEASIESRLGRNVEVVYRYNAAYNGIAVRMNATEAQQVSTLAGIRRMTRDYTRELLTDNGPRWIGAPSIWGEDPPDGNAPCTGNCGEGIVAGIIDTGVNFDHESFADIGGDGYDHSAPAGMLFYKGACAAQPVGLPGVCNDKLIGYYDFTQTTPEDGLGHGSHTASTTGGNVVTATMQGPTVLLERPISGVAPHANVISYKACQELTGNCLISGILGAINAATLDVVDVINYSIGGGSSNPWVDDDAQAFKAAHDAGIFVATSAGNSGPGFGTMGSPADAPWVTSVGASTHDRQIENGVVDMTSDGGPLANIFGAGITAGYPSAEYPHPGGEPVARIVYAGNYPSTETETPELCGAGAGDPATGEASGGSPWTGQGDIFAGMIVVCDRGEYGRVAKGGYVQEHGALGYVLINDAANGDSIVADAHLLPAVHISFANGIPLKAWLGDGSDDSHRAKINGMTTVEDAGNADNMAGFSSRGANPSVPNIIKPDVTAPGVNILAAYHTPVGDCVPTLDPCVPEYNIISGTSMSSPHTAGAGALLRAAHPEWTVDEVKSALMTVAFTTTPGQGSETHNVKKEDGTTDADPFDMGAGRVNLHQSPHVGFVLNESDANYDNADPANAGNPDYIDVRQLNIASLADNDCGAANEEETCSWTRTIKGTVDGTNWMISSTTPPGMVLTASPSSFSLDEGETQEILFTADVSAMVKDGQWHFAEVQFTDSAALAPQAHFPVAVIPQDFGGTDPVGTLLYFHGNNHDDCEATGAPYTGVGQTDLPAGCEPFMSTDAELDPFAPAAKWGPVSPAVDGTAPQNLYDPNWIWDLTTADDKTLAGPMVVTWWAAGPLANPVFNEAFDIQLFVDGTLHVSERVTHNLSTPNVAQRLTSLVNVPSIVARDSVVLQIDPVFIDSQQGSFIYYDSEASCPGASGRCDSQVLMPTRPDPLKPVARDDNSFVLKGDSVSINVLANDFDPEGGPLTVTILTQPAHGTASKNLGEGVVYQHDNSMTTSDSFTYKVTDNQGLESDPATVTISIAQECFAPAGEYSINFEDGAEGWFVDTAVLTPPSQTWMLLNDPGVNGGTAWFTDALAQSDPVNGDDTSKDVRLVSPELLVSGSSHLTFGHRFRTETNFDGGVLEVSVEGGPWQDILAAGGTFIGGGYNGTFPASDFALSGRAAWTGDPNPAGFVLGTMDPVDVDLSALIGKKLRFRWRFGQDPLAGEAGGWWVDDVAVSNLFEKCTDNFPPVANDDTDTVAASGSTATNVKTNDSDPDNALGTNPETYDLSGHTIEVTSGPTHGTVTPPGAHTGSSFTYTHNGNTATSDSYEYRLTDPSGLSNTAIVTITIQQAPNEAPVANDDAAGPIDSEATVVIPVLDNDEDPDNENPPGSGNYDLSEHTVTIETPPTHGTAVPDGSGGIVYENNGDGALEDTFEYRLTDPHGAWDTAEVTITINEREVEGSCRNSLCDDNDSDKPAELTFTYTAGTCANSMNSQGSKDDCTDYNGHDGQVDTVFIRASSKDDDADSAKVYFAGEVSQ